VSPEEEKDKFMLITAKYRVPLKDANELFKNKYVFYSPSITEGVRFDIDSPQDVFIYIKGQTLRPSESFQQTTRTRNIKNKFYYCETSCNKPKYQSLDHVKQIYRTCYNQSSELNLMCVYEDENGDDKFIENLYF
jgi:hypothetical protein